MKIILVAIILITMASFSGCVVYKNQGVVQLTDDEKLEAYEQIQKAKEKIREDASLPFGLEHLLEEVFDAVQEGVMED